jgi:phage terminase small subunit
MNDDNKPSLKLISGGKGKPEKEEKSDKLTGKQEAFAQGLSEGLTNTEAYRRAYGAENMKSSTIHVEACKLAQHPKIARRLDEILSEKRGKQSMFAEKQSDRVWRNVWRLAEGDGVPPSVQQAAIALAAKMAGMLTDQVKIESVSADSKSIEQELVERLQKLSA